MSKAKQAELFDAVMQVLDAGAECGLGELYKEVLGKQEGNQQKRGTLLEVLKEMEKRRWLVNRGNVKHPTYVVHHELVGLYSRLIKAGDGAVTELCRQQNKQVQDGLTIEHKIYLLDPLAIKDFGVGSEASGADDDAPPADEAEGTGANAAALAVGADSAVVPSNDDALMSLSEPLEVAVKFHTYYQGKDVPWGNVDWEGVGCFTNKGGAREALRLMDRLGYGKLEPNKDHPDKFVWAGNIEDMVLDFDGNVVGKRSDREESASAPAVLAEANDAASIVDAVPLVEELEQAHEVVESAPAPEPEPEPVLEPEPHAVVADEFDWAKVVAVSSDKMPIEERHVGMFMACQNGRPGCPLREFMRISGRPTEAPGGIWSCSAYQFVMAMRRDYDLIEIDGSRETAVVRWIKNPKTGEAFTYTPTVTAPAPEPEPEPVVEAGSAAIPPNDGALVEDVRSSPVHIEELEQVHEAVEIVSEPEPLVPVRVSASPDSPAGRLQLQRIQGSGATVIVYEWESLTGETIPRKSFSTFDDGLAALDVIRASCFFGEGGYDEAFAQLQSVQFGYISEEHRGEPAVEAEELVGHQDGRDCPQRRVTFSLEPEPAISQPPETRDGVEDGAPPVAKDPGHIKVVFSSQVPPGRTDGLVDIGRLMFDAVQYDMVEAMLGVLDADYPAVAAIIFKNPVLRKELLEGALIEVERRFTTDDHQA